MISCLLHDKCRQSRKSLILVLELKSLVLVLEGHVLVLFLGCSVLAPVLERQVLVNIPGYEHVTAGC